MATGATHWKHVRQNLQRRLETLNIKVPISKTTDDENSEHERILASSIPLAGADAVKNGGKFSEKVDKKQVRFGILDPIRTDDNSVTTPLLGVTSANGAGASDETQGKPKKMMFHEKQLITMYEPHMPASIEKQLRMEQEIYRTFPVEHIRKEYHDSLDGLHTLEPQLPRTFYDQILSRVIREKEPFISRGALKIDGLELAAVDERPLLKDEYLPYQSSSLATYVEFQYYNRASSHYHLTVSLDQIKWDDHHLFTREDHMCRQLEAMFIEYKRREAVDLQRFYVQKIANLRILAKSVGTQLDGAHEAARLDFARQLQTIITQILDARHRRDQEEYEQRLLFNSLYSKWTDIRKWRQSMTQNLIDAGLWNPHSQASEPAVNSSLDMPSNKLQSEQKFEQEQHLTVRVDHFTTPQKSTSPLESYDAPSMNSTGVQATPLVSPATQENRDAQAPKMYIGCPYVLKIKKLLVNESKELHEWRDALLLELDECKKLWELNVFLSKKGIVSVSDFAGWKTEEKNTLVEIETRMKKCRRLPGSPIYVPLLEKSATITDIKDCSTEEQRRRHQILNQKLYIELLVNGQEVRRTPSVTYLFPGFVNRIACATQIKLLSMPTTIAARIYEKHVLHDELLAEVFIPVPEHGVTPALHQYQFSGHKMSHGSYCLESHESSEIRYMTGMLQGAVFWTADHPSLVDTERKLLLPLDILERRKEHYEKIRSNVRLRVAEVDHLADIDPNDPRNAEFVELLTRKQLQLLNKRIFRPEQFVRELLLVPKSSAVFSSRRKVLLARNRLCNLHHPQRPHPPKPSIPLYDDDISSDLYKIIDVDNVEMGGAMKRSNGERNIFSDDDVSDAELHLLYQEKTNHLRSEVISVDEVVDEQQPVTIQLDIDMLNAIFEPRRKLRPKRGLRLSSDKAGSCKIVLQIVKGSNLPFRDVGNKQLVKTDALPSDSGSMSTHTKTDVLRSFVEITFQRKTRKTFVSNGANPDWHQLLNIPILPSADHLSPAVLRQISDNIYFNLFDEIVTKDVHDPSLQKTKLERTEHRWLGSVMLPFSTLFENSAINGAFRLDTSKLSLGYVKKSPAHDSFLHMYITIDPLLSRLPEIPPRYDTISSFYVLCLKWVAQYRKQFDSSQRLFKALAADISGQPQLICRFITSQKPPDGLPASQLTRFVSRVPFTKDVVLSDGSVDDVWCTSNEFLTLREGDWEEHAILLCNYFLSYNEFDWQTYVVLGHAIPHGNVAYVLRVQMHSEGRYQAVLIDATSGMSWTVAHNLDMSSCPLQSIGTVFNGHNIWLNLQATDHPLHIVWDFNNPKHWCSLFSDEGLSYSKARDLYDCDLTTIQSTLSYSSIPLKTYVSRAQRLERLIERKFESWRNLRTQWNYAISKSLREVLETFEAVELKQTKPEDIQQALKRMIEPFESAFGFPLNFPDPGDEELFDNQHEDENSVLCAVRNTRMHENENPSAVFALAVVIYPYPAMLGSIWIYLLQLE